MRGSAAASVDSSNSSRPSIGGSLRPGGIVMEKRGPPSVVADSGLASTRRHRQHVSPMVRRSERGHDVSDGSPTQGVHLQGGHHSAYPPYAEWLSSPRLAPRRHAGPRAAAQSVSIRDYTKDGTTVRMFFPRART